MELLSTTSGRVFIDHLDLAEAALEGRSDAASAVLEMLRSPELPGFLRTRGATEAETRDILGDLIGDCFGGEKAKGGLHRLLAHYNGTCPLPAFFKHVALNRLVSLKRKKSSRDISLSEGDDPRETPDFIPSPSAGVPDQSMIPLVRDALVKAFAAADPEKLLIFRLIHSYNVPQKRVGQIWGWHESKVSRAMDALRGSLRQAIIEEIRKADPWLQIEWADFLVLCDESVDLFGG